MRALSRQPLSLLIIGFGIWAILGEAVRVQPGDWLWDFGSFVASGRAAGEGLNPYGIYPPLTFRVSMPGFEGWNPNLNPPISAILFQALDVLPPHTGFRAWFGISLAAYGVAACVLLSRYRETATPALIVLTLAMAGLWDTLLLGQIYLVLAAAAAGGWLLMHRSPFWSGMLIAMLCALKPNFLVWPVVMLLAGHRPVAVWALGATAALSILPVLVFGPEIYRQWIELIISEGSRAAFLSNASLSGIAARAGAPMLGLIISAAALAAGGVWAMVRRPSAEDASAIGLLLAIVASPIAWVHYTLFLLPVIYHYWERAEVRMLGLLLMIPVPWVLHFMGAAAWVQITIGSVYGWTVIMLLIAFLARTESPMRREFA